MKKEFTINDIQTGDIVVTKRRGNAIVIAGRLKAGSMLLNQYGVCCLNLYDENLQYEDPVYDEYDIEKVYRIIDCYDYSLDEIINKLPEKKVKLIWEREKEIDWTKVPMFTKVQVRDHENEKWRNRYFIKTGFNDSYPYITTICDGFTRCVGYNEEESYKHIRLYDTMDAKKEWYK